MSLEKRNDKRDLLVKFLLPDLEEKYHGTMAVRKQIVKQKQLRDLLDGYVNACIEEKVKQ